MATAAAGAATSLALVTPAFAQDPVDPPVAGGPVIQPSVSCVERQAPGMPRFRAHLGYTMTGLDEIVIEQGPDNRIIREAGDLTPDETGIPAGYKHVIGTHFSQGVHPSMHQAQFEGTSAVWEVTSGGVARRSEAATGSSYAQRCVWSNVDQAKVTPTADGATITWDFEVSGEGADGFGLAAWSDYREQTCSVDGKAIAAATCAGADGKLELTGLKPGQHTFRVAARAPKLCESPAETACLRFYPASPDATYTPVDPDSRQTVELTATFTVPEPVVVQPKEEPKQEPKQEPKADPPAPIVVAPPINTQPLEKQPEVIPPVVIVEPPVAKPCPKRTLRIAVPTRRKLAIRWSSVRVDGQKVAVKRRAGRLVATVPAARLTKDRVTVTVKVRYSNGSRRTVTKTVRACA
jgi:hypothetical protein